MRETVVSNTNIDTAISTDGLTCQMVGESCKENDNTKESRSAGITIDTGLKDQLKGNHNKSQGVLCTAEMEQSAQSMLSQVAENRDLNGETIGNSGK